MTDENLDSRKALDEVSQANQVDREECVRWVEREGDSFLQTRVFSQHESVHTRRGGSQRLRWGMVAAAVVIVLAVALPLFLLQDGRGRQAQEPVPTAEQVTRADSLAQLILLAEATNSEPGGVYQPYPHFSKGLTERAVAAGLLLASEGPEYHLSEPVSRAQFALWVLRAFGSRLPAGSSDAAPFADLTETPPEELRAIAAVSRAGILEGSSDGLFRPEAPLSVEEQVRATTRLTELLGSSPGTSISGRRSRLSSCLLPV
jgi:hypothetical protein